MVARNTVGARGEWAAAGRLWPVAQFPAPLAGHPAASRAASLAQPHATVTPAPPCP